MTSKTGHFRPLEPTIHPPGLPAITSIYRSCSLPTRLRILATTLMQANGEKPRVL